MSAASAASSTRACGPVNGVGSGTMEPLGTSIYCSSVAEEVAAPRRCCGVGCRCHPTYVEARTRYKGARLQVMACVLSVATTSCRRVERAGSAGETGQQPHG